MFPHGSSSRGQCLFTLVPLSLDLSFLCPADSNVGTTSLRRAPRQREVTETLREHCLVLVSVHLRVHRSSPASPLALLRMSFRLGRTDSANFLSDGVDDLIFHFMQLADNFIQNFLFHSVKLGVGFTRATDGSHS